MRSPPPALLLALLLPSIAGCPSHADNVCEDIGDCAQGGDYVFIQGCQAQAQALATEASASGCGAEYDGYYACADASYDCTGITPTFAGCGGKLSALQSCLARGAAKNACGTLDAALAACGGGADAGAGTSPTPGAPCGIGGVCEAQCYLDSVPDVCAPMPADLGSYTQCASQCTF
jgi:hypothetical protein